jgi:hypothetical protein
MRAIPPAGRAGLRHLLLVAALAACARDEPTAASSVLPRATPPTPGQSARSRVEGYRTRGEVRSGWVLDRDDRPMPVTYEVHNGKAIWEGDIVLGRADEIGTSPATARRYIRRDAGDGSAGAQAGVVRDGDNYRWPGGVMPYVIDGGVAEQNRITDAITMIESTTGGVTIIPRTNQADYIKFVPATGCSSAVGRQGGEQTIDLADDCSTGSTAHEMLHALGQIHEQSRCDRDTYVEILFDNVEDGKAHNFEKRCDDATDLGPYDFGSIMHYPLDAFSKNGQNTIRLRPNVTYDGTIGQRSALGGMDVFAMNFLYGLNNAAPVPDICDLPANLYEGTSITFDATCSTDADDKVLTYRWKFGDGTCEVQSPPAECTQAKPSHTYANDGVYQVAVWVWDGYEEEVTEQYITVQNVAPAFTLPTFAAVNEGSGIFRQLFFTDPGADTWLATADYGDGSSENPSIGINKGFIISHAWADNVGSPFTLSVSVRDDDVTTTHTTPITVNNVAPRVNAGADQTFESGQTFSFSGSFTDPGLGDAPWSWSIAWGFGSATTGSTNAQGNIAGSRKMCAAGTYSLTLSVTDKDGGTGSDGAQVTVGYVAVTADITPGATPNPIAFGKKGSLPVAVLGSATFDPTTIDPSTVTLGDESGTETPVQFAKGKWSSRIEDVNRDGRADVVFMFDVPALIANGDVTQSTTSLVIRGFQGAGGDSCTNFRGSDSVVVVPG